ncbi:hypothetical protein PMAYCL1PPCAC_13605, partial [Pristionchus mayeri]
EEILFIKCNKVTGEWMVNDKDKTVPTGSNVHCHSGCNITRSFDPSLCGSEEDCDSNISLFDSSRNCRDDFGLQVDFGAQTPSGWVEVSRVLCDNHRYKVFDKKNTAITAFPYGIRCIRKRIDS